MYTLIERRRMNPERAEEAMRRAQSEFFPKLQQAPGLIGFYIVNDEEQGVATAVVVWRDRESAKAFQPQADEWLRTLDALGHTLESSNRGETVVEITPQR
jgi:heme-degrading monooxygenase HmoA